MSLSNLGNGLVKLMICDDGVGINDIADAESLGIQIVKSLVHDQLNGEITPDNSNGTCWIISFI